MYTAAPLLSIVACSFHVLCVAPKSETTSPAREKAMHRRTRYHITWATMIIERRKGGWCSHDVYNSCGIHA